MPVEAGVMDIGYEPRAVVKAITTEKMYAFSARHGGLLENSVHTNRQVAKVLGFPNVICQGNMMLNYISEMLFKVYREHWIQHSKASVAYVKSVFPGDTLSAKGVVKEKEVANSATRLKLDVWVENKEGEKVVIGNAEVTIS